MTDRKTQEHETDARLREQFQRLRQAEQGSAPQFPHNSPSNVVALPPGKSTSYWRLPQMAAAVAVVAVGVGLFVQQPQEDPAALYSDIMSAQLMQTDALMDVSSSVLPAVYDLPHLYDADFTYDTNTLIN